MGAAYLRVTGSDSFEQADRADHDGQGEQAIPLVGLFNIHQADRPPLAGEAGGQVKAVKSTTARYLQSNNPLPTSCCNRG